MNNYLKAVRVLLTITAVLILTLTVFVTLNFKNISDAADSQDVAITPAIDPPTLPIIEDAKAVAGAMVFKNNCKTCHRIDIKLIGPPLRDVYSRRDEQWIRNWIVNSSKMIAGGDQAAVELFMEYKKTAMTNFTSMSKEDLDAVISYLKYAGEHKDSKFD